MMRVLLIATAIALAGCGSAPKESFYTLASPQAPVNATSTVSVFVGPVSVPEAVDRTPMVIRTGPNQVDIDEMHRWAEPLKTAIPRVLAEMLMRELGSTRVVSSRQASGTAVDFRVAVEIQRFESSLDGGATLDAVWFVTPTASGATRRTGRTLATVPATGRFHEALAAAHSRALESLARDIAQGVRLLAQSK